MGAIHEPGEALVLVPAQPPMHGLTRHVEASRHLNDRNAIADHREHCLIPLLHDTQLHQHVGSVSRIRRSQRHPSGEAVSPLSRSRDVTHQAEPHSFPVGPRGFEPRTCGLRVRCSTDTTGATAEGGTSDRRHYAHPRVRRSILEAGVVGAESPEIIPEGERSGQMDGVDHAQLGRP